MNKVSRCTGSSFMGCGSIPPTATYKDEIATYSIEW